MKIELSINPSFKISHTLSRTVKGCCFFNGFGFHVNFDSLTWNVSVKMMLLEFSRVFEIELLE